VVEKRQMKTGVAYFETRNLRHVKEDLADMVAHNCTFVVHTMSEYDLNFNTLVMKDIVSLSHDMGLEVYINPWGVGRVFGGPEPYSHWIAERPDQCQKMNDGSHAPIACLVSRPFRDYVKYWIDQAAATGADVVFWDEPHYYYTHEMLFGGAGRDRWACACDRCRALFREQYGRDFPPSMDDDVIRFRDEAVLDLFSEITAYAAGHGMKNAVCVLPDENPLVGLSTWDGLAEIESLDIFGTDPYWMVFDRPLDQYVRATARRVMEICDRTGKEAQLWVQAFLIWKDREEEVARAVEIMAEEGITNIAAWAYLGSAYWNHKCQDHEKVWEILGRAFGEAAGAQKP
jgi:hypothetical protein